MLTPLRGGRSGASVRTRGLVFGYPRTSSPVLQGVDFSIAPAESVCLWGPSGSGKSTMLSLIGGVLSPDAGELEVLGAGSGARGGAEPAWVLQTANLLPGSTARENVLLAGLLAGKPRDQAALRADAALQAVGLGDFSAYLAKRLSGGQAQRVAVARALAVDSPLVLADEPSGQLDHEATRLVCDALLGDAGRRATVVIASHDSYVASRCDRVLTFENGRVR